MTKPTTHEDARLPSTERRPYVPMSYNSKVGRSTVNIACPFCNATITAYVWSLNGGGKRCTCGALFTGSGMAYRRVDAPKEP